MNNQMRKNKQGFTLIELIITVAIIGILAAAAWPSYDRYQQRGRRADGIGALMQASAQMEKCFLNLGAYTTCTVTSPSPEQYYAISISNLTAETYTLTATPQNAQAGDGECATLTINQLGVKGFTTTTTDPAGTLKRCWSQ